MTLRVIRDWVEPAAGPAMSALPRKRPTIVLGPHVAKGHYRKSPPHSITSSALVMSDCGIMRSSALAALRLTIN